MNTLHYIYFSMLYGTIVCFISQHKHWNHTLKILFMYLIILAAVSTSAMVMQLHKINNLFLYRIFTPVEYALLCLMYYSSMKKSTIKKAIHLSVYGFFAVCVLITFFVEGWKVIDSYAKTIESLLITIWILIYFRQTLITSKILNLHNDPLFWISMGFLIYLIGSFFILGLLNQLIAQNRKLASQVYRYGYLFELHLFIQMNIALFCRKMFRDHVKV